MILDFTQIMEQLISSGLSIKDALEIATEIGNNSKKSSRLASTILNKINKGYTFAETINTMNTTFPPLYIGLIMVGDKIGSIEKIFPRLLAYLETQKKIKDKISNALLYPLLVLITAFLALTGMIIFVFPKLEQMFMDLGGIAAEKLNQNIAHLRNCFLILAIFILALFFCWTFIHITAKNDKNLKYKIDKFILKIPILGQYIIYRESLNFSFAMETLTGSGITIENAITETLSVITNEAYKQALTDVTSQIVKGDSLSDAFSSHEEFPNYIKIWIKVGEKSENTTKVFLQLKNFFQNEIDIFLTRFMALIEPTLILLIGAGIITLIVSIIIPIFSLYGDLL